MKNMNSNIQIRIIEKANIIDLVALYEDATWWDKDDSTDYLDTMVTNSFCFVGAFDNEKMIGMGRAISDGCSDAYIQDIIVLSKYRKHGIGNKIVKKIVVFLKESKISWIGLIGEPGTESFYEKLNFKKMKNYIPMKYDDKI